MIRAMPERKRFFSIDFYPKYMNLTFFNLVVTRGKGKVNEMMKREKLINLSVQRKKTKRKEKKRGKEENATTWFSGKCSSSKSP